MILKTNRKLDILKKLGSTVRGVRLSQGLSQEKLAEICDLHRTYIGMIERGEKNITITSLYRIAAALNVTPSKLIEGLTDGE